MLNLKVRMRQKWFWITLIPLLFLLFDQCVQMWQAAMSFTIGDMMYEGQLMNLAINAIGVVFAILALVGFPVDLTTSGYGDSEQALDRTVPAPNAIDSAEHGMHAAISGGGTD